MQNSHQAFCGYTYKHVHIYMYAVYYLYMFYKTYQVFFYGLSFILLMGLQNKKIKKKKRQQQLKVFYSGLQVKMKLQLS